MALFRQATMIFRCEIRERERQRKRVIYIEGKVNELITDYEMPN